MKGYILLMVCSSHISHCEKKLRDSWIFFDQTFQGLELGRLFPARESLVSDIPAGDGKSPNLYSQCFMQAFILLIVYSIHTSSCKVMYSSWFTVYLLLLMQGYKLLMVYSIHTFTCKVIYSSWVIVHIHIFSCKVINVFLMVYNIHTS